jgi:hypothetical protein
MSVETWQTLPKNQESAETIEEAIDRKIQAHNDDVTAHLGENQSIEAHRQSEVIDHLAESIVTDKIQENSITPEKFLFNKNVYNTTFSDLHLWDILDQNGDYEALPGLLNMSLSAGSENYISIKAKTVNNVIYSKTKRFQWETQLVPEMDTIDYLISFGIGSGTGQFVGFQIRDNVLFAFHRPFSGSTQEVEVSNLDVFTVHNYRIVGDGSGNISFYVDDVLVAEITLVGTVQSMGYGFFEIKNVSDDYQSLNIFFMRVFQDY